MLKELGCIEANSDLPVHKDLIIVKKNTPKISKTFLDTIDYQLIL